MKRYLCVVLPSWSADRVLRRLRRTASKQLERAADRRGSAPGQAPCILLTARRAGGSAVAPTVARCCAVAAAAGVRPGTSLAQARGLLFGRPIHVEPHDAQADRAGLAVLARAAERYSSCVGTEGADGLVLEIGGSERLFGGERTLVHTALRWLDGLGLEARAGVASTIGCAWGLARFAPASRAQDAAHRTNGTDTRPDASPSYARAAPGAEATALGPLPVAALRLDADVVEALAELGVERVEQFMALPRWELPARFHVGRGSGGRGRAQRASTHSESTFGEHAHDALSPSDGRAVTALERLDQALGRQPETLRRVRAPLRPRVERQFAGPVRDRAALGFALRLMLDELVEQLAARGLGTAQLVVELWPSDAPADAPPKRLVRHTSRAGRDARHLWSLLDVEIERAPIGFGVERVALEARALREQRGEQSTLAGTASGASDPHRHPAADDRDFAELVDAFVTRLGPRAVFAAEAFEDPRPECAFRVRPPTAPPRAAHVPRRPRPTRLFTEPRPVEVELDPAADRPRAFTEGHRRHRILRCFALERFALPWWPGAPRSVVDTALGRLATGVDLLDVRAYRDSFRVLDEDGRWSWLVRARIVTARVAMAPDVTARDMTVHDMTVHDMTVHDVRGRDVTVREVNGREVNAREVNAREVNGRPDAEFDASGSRGRDPNVTDPRTAHSNGGAPGRSASDSTARNGSSANGGAPNGVAPNGSAPSRLTSNASASIGASANGTAANVTSWSGTTANGTTAKDTTANGTASNGTTASGIRSNSTEPSAANSPSDDGYDVVAERWFLHGEWA
ncbi:hypothetical protein Pla163_22380 [Planctomycetes bacterium Pla163]|uniref:UmuC domain-containing protein n=1 Tax=Rohdeia mirabilis TaxID=2528008 RepID=A0A518D0U8_9BACT|nr:hypothetical protein Pla163_22380 [Planctomycetes bacterium Pla163]